MKIKYSNGFHGYNNAGFPIITDEASAATFADKGEALNQVGHDGACFDFWAGSFQLV